MNQGAIADLSAPSMWQPILVGTRLQLRPLGEADRARLYAVARDPKIWESHPVPERWQPHIFQRFFDDLLRKCGAMAIFAKSSDTMIGSSTFQNYKPEESVVEIGSTFLATGYWGGSFNRELKMLMLSHAFQYVDRVVFRIGSSNIRSRKACEKIGGRLTGRTEEIEGPSGPMPHVIYQIDRAEFDPNPLEILD